MKKYLLLLLTFFALSSCEQDAEIVGVDAEKKPETITICHYNKGNDTWKSIEIQEKHLQRHLDHGDKIGQCGYTYVPDDKFEYYLIYKGLDDVMDDYVLTSNINTIEGFEFEEAGYGFGFPGIGEPGISDWTGLEGFESLKTLSINNNHYVSNLVPNLLKLPNLIGFGLRTELEDPSFLDLSKTSLKGVGFYASKVGTLILPETIESAYFHQCYNLTTVDLSNCPNLNTIDIYDGYFEILDLSANSVLEKVNIEGCAPLVELNLKNGNNTFIKTTLYNVISPLLTCIQVDDADYSNDNWLKDDWVTFSEDCGY